MKRRHFALGLLPFLALIGCQKLTAPLQELKIISPQEPNPSKSNPRDFIASGSVASFLEDRFETDYQSHFYPDWLLLTFLDSWGENYYKYFIDGEYTTSPINLTTFNPRLQKLTITLEDDTLVWEHKPRHRGTHYVPHQQEVSGLR